MDLRILNSRRRASRLAFWLVLASIVLRGVIPVGYMPDFSTLRAGQGPIVLCATGIPEVPLRQGHAGPQGSDPQKEGKSPCDYAAMASLSASAPPAAVLAPIWPAVGAWSPAEDVHWHTRRQEAAQSPRAPPTLS